MATARAAIAKVAAQNANKPAIVIKNQLRSDIKALENEMKVEYVKPNDDDYASTSKDSDEMKALAKRFSRHRMNFLYGEIQKGRMQLELKLYQLWQEVYKMRYEQSVNASREKRGPPEYDFDAEHEKENDVGMKCE